MFAASRLLLYPKIVMLALWLMHSVSERDTTYGVKGCIRVVSHTARQINNYANKLDAFSHYVTFSLTPNFNHSIRQCLLDKGLDL